MFSPGQLIERLPLPKLRPDLKIYPGPAAADGSPTWSLHDTARNKFFRLGWAEFQMLSFWDAGNDVNLVTKIALETPIAVTRERVKLFVEFLQFHNLTLGSGKAYRELLKAQYDTSRKATFVKRVMKLLFLRIPLIRPQKLLARLYPYIRFVFGPMFFRIVAALGIVGIYLTLRQFDLFLHSAARIFSLEGVAYTFGAIAFVKLVHEFAHAFTAYRLGCYVPTMGINFILGVPILYTDVSDSWRLRSKYQRMSIGAAGVISEFYMACIATFIWAFLPESLFKHMMFFVATTSWFMSLAINLNPLMRFDGYFILSDFFALPNMGSRATALMQWHLRKFLFGIDVEKPEKLPVKVQKGMIAFGYATGIYRFFLYLGIAYSVYLMLFKLLGLFMMITEIAIFIVKPIYEEVKKLRTHKEKITWNRKTRRSVLLLFLLLLILFYPWQGRIEAAGLVRAKEYTRIYTPIPARVESFNVVAGQKIQKGQLIAELYSPQLEYDLHQTNLEIEKLRWQISRQKLAKDVVKVAQVLEEDLSAEITKLAGLLQEKESLVVKAPFDGYVLQTADALLPGRWVDDKMQLALVVDPSEYQVTAYVNEDDLPRLRTDRAVKFYTSQPETKPFWLQVKEIDKVNTKELHEDYLASIHDGDISVEETDKKGVYTPVKTIYRVVLEPVENDLQFAQVMKGRAYFKGQRQSIFGWFKNLALGVVIRESGF